MTEEEMQHFANTKIRWFEDGVQIFKNLFYQILYFNSVNKITLKVNIALKIIEIFKDLLQVIGDKTIHSYIYIEWYSAGIYYFLNYKTSEPIPYKLIGQKEYISTTEIVNIGFSNNYDLFKSGFLRLGSEFEEMGIKNHREVIKSLEFLVQLENSHSNIYENSYTISEKTLKKLIMIVGTLATDTDFEEKNYDTMIEDINNLNKNLEKYSKEIVKIMISHPFLRDKIMHVYKTYFPQIHQNAQVQNIIEKIKNETATPNEIQVEKSIKKLEMLLERFLIYSSLHSEEELYKNSKIVLEKLVVLLKTRNDEDRMKLIMSEIGGGAHKGGANTQRRTGRKLRKQRKHTRKQKQYRSKKRN
jgi:hypothetical protein